MTTLDPGRGDGDGFDHPPRDIDPWRSCAVTLAWVGVGFIDAVLLMAIVVAGWW